MPLNEIQKLHGPFAFKTPKDWGCSQKFFITSDAADRTRKVRQSTDAEWLEAVIAHKQTQKTVRKAAESRLRWVEKACVALLNDYQLREAAEVKS